MLRGRALDSVAVRADPDWVLRASWIEADVRVDEREHREVSRPAIVVRHLLVPDHGITAIIGESGSGKSSLLALLTGLKPAVEMASGSRQAGELSELWFRAGARQKPRNLLAGQRSLPGDVGFVFQDAHLLKSISAKRNAAFGAVIAPGAPALRVFGGWSTRLGLDKTGFEPLETYSGGQQQRISVMRALGMDPALLVCDEPTSSLDAATADIVMTEISRWASQPGRAVLWVTHSRELAARYAHRVLGVHNGQLCVHADGWPIEQSPAGDSGIRCNENIRQMEAVLNGDVPSAHRAPVFSAATASDPSTATASAQPRRKAGWWERRGASLRAAAFAFTSSMAMAFADVGRDQAANKPKWPAWAWPMVFCMAAYRIGLRSLTLILLLGMTVFYSVFTAYTAFDRHFSHQMAAPESSHFTITATNPTLFAATAIQHLDKTLASPTDRPPSADETISAALTRLVQSVLPAPSMLRSPKHFGRRTANMAPIWHDRSGSCDRPQTSTFGPPMLVFNRQEPLFSQLDVVRLRGARAIVANIEPKDLRGGAIVTRGIFGFLGVDKADEDKLEGFCAELDFGAPVYLRIVGIVNSLPGGGDRQYSIAIDEETYRGAFSKADARITNMYRDKDGRLQLPSYQQVAGYFDFRERDRVFCGYLGCNVGQDDPINACQAQSEGAPAHDAKKPLLPGYRVDCDSLARISKLIETAGGAKLMFLALAIAFLASTVLSTVLAAAALVEENAKPIAVMRAFGYSVGDVFVLLFGQLVVMLLSALTTFLLLVAGFDAFIAGRLAETVDVPVSDVSGSLNAVLFSAAVVALTVAIVALVVLMQWWSKHRHVGPVLQAL